ncbi:MAG: DUF1003 domain-containing protein [Candidatus Doudnabacteria bacterium]|nr:DUF1003 domain-containing protein [Candidatus Doudnabacteria bacterium]
MSRNLNKIHEEKLTRGDRMADKVSDFLGSWEFIMLVALVLLFWIVLNIYAYQLRWDPYPFILLNLVLSVTAAVEVPIILMSQNRMEEKDRLRAELDFETNVKAEKEIEDIKRELVEIRVLLSQKTRLKSTNKKV